MGDSNPRILCIMTQIVFVNQSDIHLDRKVLSEMAIYEPRTFQVSIGGVSKHVGVHQ